MNLAGPRPRTPATKLPTPKLPKLTRISVRPIANGMLVTHQFHAAPAKQFQFRNPLKAKQHLERALNTEWMHPNAPAEAQKIEQVIDV